MRVFAYGYSTAQQRTLDTMLAGLHCGAAGKVLPEHGEATIEEIVEDRALSGTPLSETEMSALPHELEAQEINRFINAYAQTALPQPIMAAVTDVNRRWTFRNLLLALRKERKQVEDACAGLEDVE